jgi:hypothetical protein
VFPTCLKGLNMGAVTDRKPKFSGVQVCTVTWGKILAERCRNGLNRGITCTDFYASVRSVYAKASNPCCNPLDDHPALLAAKPHLELAELFHRLACLWHHLDDIKPYLSKTKLAICLRLLIRTCVSH